MFSFAVDSVTPSERFVNIIGVEINDWQYLTEINWKMSERSNR